MSASRTKICNMALSHLGISKQIANVETERSAEAEACREFLDQAIEEVLLAWAWPFASKIASLALVEEDPNTEWAFSYQYPSDCLRITRILNDFDRNETIENEVKFRVQGDNDGRQILTDKEDAQAEYTVKITNVARFDADSVMCISLLLAAYTSSRITKGDPFKKGDRALQLFYQKLPNTAAKAANEERRDRAPESEFIRARE
jgi:hypothetical protein